MRKDDEVAVRGSLKVHRNAGMTPECPRLIGDSESIREIRQAIDLVAPSSTSVLITGKSGTGKEVVARMIHSLSDRAMKPFIAINCGALPKDVIENELFGHEQGAFTGALLKKAGCFELANGGTLFFDEIAEMYPETQVKLLRAIELQSFRRLGGSEEISVDVRMLAATNKDITRSLSNGSFREDLYYRFSVIEIHLPPLQDRPEDIPLLIENFLGWFASKYGAIRQEFSPAALEALKGYAWPGNIRELRNVVERSVVVCRDPVIGPEALPSKITRNAPANGSIVIPVGTSLREAERTIILRTLTSVHGNVSAAARVLNLSRRTLSYKLASYKQ